jgi:hypothetical protein
LGLPGAFLCSLGIGPLPLFECVPDVRVDRNSSPKPKCRPKEKRGSFGTDLIVRNPGMEVTRNEATQIHRNVL